MVADDSLLVGVGQGPEAGERARGVVLVEAPERGGDASRQVVRVGGDGGIEDPPGRERPADALERNAVRELLLHPTGCRAPLELVELLLGGQALEPRRRLDGCDERRAARCEVRVENVVGADRGRRVGLPALDLAPLPGGALAVAVGQEGEAEVETGDAAVRLLGDQRLEALDRPVRPGGDGRSDRGLDRVGVRRQQLLEAGARLLALAVLELLLRVAERAGLGVVSDEEPQFQRRRRPLRL